MEASVIPYLEIIEIMGNEPSTYVKLMIVSHFMKLSFLVSENFQVTRPCGVFKIDTSQLY